MLYDSKWPRITRQIRNERNHACGRQTSFRFRHDNTHVRLTQEIAPHSFGLVSGEIGIVRAERFVEAQYVGKVTVFGKPNYWPFHVGSMKSPVTAHAQGCGEGMQGSYLSRILLKVRDALAADLLRAAFGADLPPFNEARVGSADFTDIRPAQYQADLVILLAGEAVDHGVIVEVRH